MKALFERALKPQFFASLWSLREYPTKVAKSLHARRQLRRFAYGTFRFRESCGLHSALHEALFAAPVRSGALIATLGGETFACPKSKDIEWKHIIPFVQQNLAQRFATVHTSDAPRP